jgi:hypothetical protein
MHTEFEEMYLEDVNGIHLAQSRNHRKALVNLVKRVQFPYIATIASKDFTWQN